jgi:hypothetical protein
LEYFTVQRAFVSFCDALAGFSGQISRCPSGLHRGLLVLGVTLPGGSHEARSHDLPRARDEPGDVDLMIEPFGEVVRNVHPDQRLPELPERVRVRHRVGNAQATDPHPAQPVADHLLGRFRGNLCRLWRTGIRNFRTTSIAGRPPFGERLCPVARSRELCAKLGDGG